MIGVGNRILVPKKAGWDYDGIMTVGFMRGFPYDYYGYILSYLVGSMNPTSPQVTGYNITVTIAWGTDGILRVYDGSSAKSCNTIEIDGVEFTGFNSSGQLSVASNPFPAAFTTCTIKMA